jgi:hypothetical protein
MRKHLEKRVRIIGHGVDRGNEGGSRGDGRRI